jgi:large subunit ribosomal protein L1
MTRLTKNRKLALEKIETEKAYKLNEAATLVKEITKAKFDSSVDLKW